MRKKLPLLAGSLAGLAIILSSLQAADAPAPAPAAASSTTKAAPAASTTTTAAPAGTAPAAASSSSDKPDLSKLPPASDKKGLVFDKDIEPILKASCSTCHVGGTRFSGSLNLSTLADALKGGKDGKDIVPGHSDQSLVVLYTSDAVKGSEMPPLNRRPAHAPLTKDQIGLIRAWIDQGAK